MARSQNAGRRWPERREALMLAHGFRREVLAGLVLAELATIVTRVVRAGGATTMKIDRYLITDDGREALGES